MELERDKNFLTQLSGPMSLKGKSKANLYIEKKSLHTVGQDTLSKTNEQKNKPLVFSWRHALIQLHHQAKTLVGPQEDRQGL